MAGDELRRGEERGAPAAGSCTGTSAEGGTGGDQPPVDHDDEIEQLPPDVNNDGFDGGEEFEELEGEDRAEPACQIDQPEEVALNDLFYTTDIWVGNVHPKVKSGKLKRLLGADSVKRIRYDGSAILYFKELKNAIKALKFNGVKLMGHEIMLQWLGNPINHRSILIRGFPSNLSAKRVQCLVRRHFSSCGTIKQISVPTIRGTSRKRFCEHEGVAVPIFQSGGKLFNRGFLGKKRKIRGIAFVDFENSISILKAMILDKDVVAGYPIEVELNTRTCKPAVGKPVICSTDVKSAYCGKRTVFREDVLSMWCGKKKVFEDDEKVTCLSVNSRLTEQQDRQENTNPTDQARSKKRTASILDSTKETDKEGNQEYNLDEPTMEQKLESLNLLKKSEFVEEQPVSLAPPSADSVHILLKQALRADDHAELLKCLYNRDGKVILKSISLLTPADVLKLLKFFVSSMQSRGAKLVCLLPWLQTLLSWHMSSIVSQESSLLLLNSLYQLIDERTSAFSSALQLSTILDYRFSEVVDDENDEEEAAATIIYEDKDTYNEESVDAMETDGESEELGDTTDAFEHSDGSDIMSD